MVQIFLSSLKNLVYSSFINFITFQKEWAFFHWFFFLFNAQICDFHYYFSPTFIDLNFFFFLDFFFRWKLRSLNKIFLSFLMQTAHNLWWFDLWFFFFYFTVMQKQYTFNRNCTLNFDYFFPRLALCGTKLSHDAWQWQLAEAPSQPCNQVLSLFLYR